MDQGKKFIGVTKWFDPRKGYGFIVCPEANAADLFVYHASIQGGGYRTLTNGERVEFTTAPRGERGIEAKNVKRLGVPSNKVVPAAAN